MAYSWCRTKLFGERLRAEQNEHIEEWRRVFDFFEKDEGSSSALFDTPVWAQQLYETTHSCR